MTWSRFDDGADGDKLALAMAEVGDAAAAMWFRAILHCSRNLTDGFVDAKFLRGLTCHKSPAKVAEALVNAVVVPGQKGLFERTEGGFLVHDYLKFHPTRAEVLADRERARARMEARRSGDVRANTTRTVGEQKQEQEANEDGTEDDCSGEPRGRARGRPPAPASRPVPSRPVHTPGAGAVSPRAHAHEAPAPPPPELTPEQASALAELQRHPRLAPAANPDFARELHAAAAMAGKLALLPRALAQAADKITAVDTGNAVAVRRACLSFARNALPQAQGSPRGHVPQTGPLTFTQAKPQPPRPPDEKIDL